MEIRELKFATPVKEKEVIYIGVPFGLPGQKKVNIQKTKVYTTYLTDGAVCFEMNQQQDEICNYSFENEKYQYIADILKTKDIYFKHYTYVIEYLIAKEPICIENDYKEVDVLKDIKIYLNNLNDKKALKKAKKEVRKRGNFGCIPNNLLDNFVFTKPKSGDLNVTLTKKYDKRSDYLK